jgi:serine/threonine protein kinase
MANPEDLGRYRLKRLLGRGALGEVWEASDLEQQGTKVAVKIMHAADDELIAARIHFAREARLASLMRHPNVVAVHDAGEAAGTSFLVMDMVEGQSLRSLISDSETTTAEKLRWLRQIGDGLSAMHRAGVVHRDLKPENVIIRADRTACLVDLGIAKWTKFDLGGERDPENELEAAAKPPPPVSDYAPPETIAQEHYDELAISTPGACSLTSSSRGRSRRPKLRRSPSATTFRRRARSRSTELVCRNARTVGSAWTSSSTS